MLGNFMFPFGIDMLVGMTGEEFKKWRLRMNLTQAEVAKALDVTEMTVYRWETDKAPILRTVELALKQVESERAKKS
jgi:transcriptional regulator with XRE-family HTH domain